MRGFIKAYVRSSIHLQNAEHQTLDSSRNSGTFCFGFQTVAPIIGMGRVSFSTLGSGFGFFDYAQVGFRVF